MKVALIVNPRAGHNRRRPDLVGRLRAELSAYGLVATVETTLRPGHATDLAAAAARRGATVAVAVGGDGTMNEVARGLIGTGTGLALLPCGSGNGLALHLGLPRTLPGLLQLLSSPPSWAAIDVGFVNGRPFFNAMGLGFDADISHRFNRLTRRGLPAYFITGWRAWRERREETVRISHGGQLEERTGLVFTIANSDQYGNNARIAPGARVDDGLLDLIVVRPRGLRSLPTLGYRLFRGTFDRSPLVRRWRVARVVLERGAPGLVHTDGETHLLESRLEVEVRPGALRVLVPAGHPLAQPFSLLAAS